MVWNVFIVIIFSIWVVDSMEGYYQPPRTSAVWGYFTPPVLQRVPPQQEKTPMEAMVELTNNLGVAILQDHSFSRGNFAFAPYGVASVLVVLYEGARGESARQIHRAVKFPSDKDIIRVGFRDLHRRLRSYFSHEGYLSGISLNKESSSLKPEYKKILKFYGYDVDISMSFDDEDDSGSGNNTPETSKTTEAPRVTSIVSNATSGVNLTTKRPTETTVSTVTNPPTTVMKEIVPEVPVKTDVDETTTALPVTEPKVTTTAVPTVEPQKGTTVISVTEQKEAATKPPATESAVKNTELPATESAVKNTELPATESAVKNTELPATESAVKNTELPATESVVGNTELPATEAVLGTTPTTVAQPQNLTTVIRQNEGTTMISVTEQKEAATKPPATELVAETAELPAAEPVPGTTPTTVVEPQNLTTVIQQKEETTTSPMTEGVNGVTTTPTVELQNVKTMIPPTEGATVPSVTEEVAGTTAIPVSETPNVITAIPPKEEVIELSTGETLGETTPHPVDELKTTTAMPVNATTTPAATEDDSEFQLNITIGRNIDCKNGSACNNSLETTKNSANQTATTPLPTEGATKQETKTTQTKVEEVTNVSIDNGMLIPQPNDTTAKQPTEDEANVTESLSGPRETKDIKEEFESDIESDFNKILNLLNSHASLWLDEKPKLRKARTIADYLKSPHNPDLSLQLQNGMYDTHVSRRADSYRKLPRLMFLVDGAVDTPVPMMIYNNVFSYAYIPRLHSKALEFPLDDVRYKLLILLPVERRGLRQLIYDLGDCPLSVVLDTMRPARVKAVIPTFMVEGFVILTSSLQKLGIWDVFDPRKANLSGMSTDPELYVRNVEQSVTVVIRNYVEILDIQTRTMAARQMEYEFKVTHPFLYFVLDSDTNVALMAGQILDPLNSRIY